MPTYRYRCPKCGHEYDKFQKITDRTRAKCPECGVRGERVITGGGGLLFKGSGFYVTDYRKADKPGKREEADGKPDAASGSPAKPSGEKKSTGAKKTGADS